MPNDGTKPPVRSLRSNNSKETERSPAVLSAPIESKRHGRKEGTKKKPTSSASSKKKPGPKKSSNRVKFEQLVLNVQQQTQEEFVVTPYQGHECERSILATLQEAHPNWEEQTQRSQLYLRFREEYLRVHHTQEVPSQDDSISIDFSHIASPQSTPQSTPGPSTVRSEPQQPSPVTSTEEPKTSTFSFVKSWLPFQGGKTDTTADSGYQSTITQSKVLEFHTSESEQDVGDEDTLEESDFEETLRPVDNSDGVVTHDSNQSQANATGDTTGGGDNPGDSSGGSSTSGEDNDEGRGENNEEKGNEEDNDRPSRSPSPKDRASPVIMATEAQKTHVICHDAILKSVQVFRTRVNNHKACNPVLNPIEVEIFLQDLLDLRPDISAQYINCFKLYEDDTAQSGVKHRENALIKHKEIDDIFHYTRTELTKIVQQNQSMKTTSKLETPKISLPKFNGLPNYWQSFKAQFTAIVSSSTNYADVDKLRLLMDALRDSPPNASIADLEITEFNWPIAWKRMEDRYDSPREQAHAAIRPLLQFQPLSSQSSNGLHNLVNTVRTTRAQLTGINLGGVSEAEVLYLHFIMARLDSKTISEFNQSIPDSKIPTLDTCILFLEKQAKNVAATQGIKANSSPSTPKPRSHRTPSTGEKRVVFHATTDSDGYTSGASTASRIACDSVASTRSRKSKRRPTLMVKKKSSSSTKKKRRPRSKSTEMWRSPARGKSPHPSPSSSKGIEGSFTCKYCSMKGHRLFNCMKFSESSNQHRRDWVLSNKKCFNCLGNHNVKDCNSSYRCRECKKKHHSILHSPGLVTALCRPVLHSATSESNEYLDVGILPTAVVDVLHNGHRTTARALLDTGSNSSFITEKLSAQLALILKETHEEFSGAGGRTLKSSGKTQITIQSKVPGKQMLHIEAFVLPEITSELPSHPIKTKSWVHLNTVPLADPQFFTPKPIDILLGSAVVEQIWESGAEKIQGAPGQPSLYETSLGFIVMGNAQAPSQPRRHINTVQNIDFDLEKFWNIEELPYKKLFTPDEAFCEEHYKKNVRRLANGQYEVKWPFRENHPTLGNSMDLAIKRWYSTEQRLLKDPKLHKTYIDQLEEYLTLDQMILSHEWEGKIQDKQPFYMIPHHHTTKESSTSTKVRIVFDASAKTSNRISLNNILIPGPTIQALLFEQLLKFRLRKIATVADIAKMYRQILVHPSQWTYSRIVWRRTPSGPLLFCIMKTIPFGCTSSPYLACRTLVQLADDEEHNYPLGAEALRKDFYVDDYMASHDDVDTAKEVQRLQASNRIGKHGDLTEIISRIVSSYTICFIPVMILKITDPAETLPQYVHGMALTLVWISPCLNLTIYAASNRKYRRAFISLYRKPSKAQRNQDIVDKSTGLTTALMTIVTLVLIILGPVGATYERSPDLASKYQPCKTRWDTYQEIPICHNTTTWLHIQNNGTVCSRTKTCMRPKPMVSSDGQSCLPPDERCQNYTPLTLDHLKCQTVDSVMDISKLQHEGVKSSLCAVDGYKLKECRHFTEKLDFIPVIITGNTVTPMLSIHIRQDAQLRKFSSYTCMGHCPQDLCKQKQCNGDDQFCEHIGCNPDTKGPPCNCTYNKETVMHKIQTLDEPYYPDCWGHMYVMTKKQDLSRPQTPQECEDCDLTCKPYEIYVTTPGITARYIRVQKNPSYISVIPTSSKTEVHLTNHMLANTGNSTVEVWMPDVDVPIVKILTCPRIPICMLIKCHLCLERWGNVSCYDYYQYIILSILGLVISSIIIFIFYVTRIFMWLSWWLCYPIRKIMQVCVTRNQGKRNKLLSVHVSDEELGVPLIDHYPQPYQSTTTPFGRRSSKLRRALYLPGNQLSVILIIGCLPLALGCSNSASMAAATNECHTSGDQTTCVVRVNTRLALGPIGQSSCFRIDDSHNELLGTITIETKSVALQCEKELLYYVPKAVAKCQSSIKCYNLYSDANCHGDKCDKFGANDTIKDFMDSRLHKGWSSCRNLRISTCPWIFTEDCQFIRLWLDNPTNEIYRVYDCPEWKFSTEITVTSNLGNVTNTDTTRLVAGVPITLHGIEFNLITVSTPPIPLLSECIISKGSASSIVPCNKRGESTLQRLGEIACDTEEDAKLITPNCIASNNLIRLIADNSGVKCISSLIDPNILMKVNPLPLHLESGILVPRGDSIVFESSSNTLLEIQLSTENLQLIKQIQDTSCEAEFIKIVGCYNCISASTLFLQAKVDKGSSVAILECPTQGFFIPIALTEAMTTHQLSIKMDTPEVDFLCHLKCARNRVPIKIKGQLHYLANINIQDEHVAVSYTPPDHDGGFHLFSITGFGIFAWFTRGIIAIVLFIVILITLIGSLKLILRKMV